MDRVVLAAACDAVPLFPLPGVMLVPGTTLPLHVFEPRYRQLVSDVISSGVPIALPQIIHTDDVDLFGTPPIHPYAGMGFIHVHQALPDGRYNIFVQGTARAHIEEVSASGHPYRVGKATLLDDEPASTESVGRLGLELRALIAPMLARAGERARVFLHGLNDLDPARVPDALAAMVLKDDALRQQFLAENHPIRRAEMVEEALLVAVTELRSGPSAEA